MKRNMFHEVCRNDYLEIYHAYRVMNQVCWGGTLPAIPLSFSSHGRRLRAYAASSPSMKINFNITNCITTLGDDLILGVLAHEMTHIWQFVNGKHGGHGKDFRNEMLRIGIDEKRCQVNNDSPFAFSVRLLRMRAFSYTAAFQRIRRCRHSLQIDECFFRENLC